MGREDPVLGEIIPDALSARDASIFFRVSRALASAFPDRYVLETSTSSFEVFPFARDGHCEVSPLPDVHSQFEVSYDASLHSSAVDANCAWSVVTWQKHRFELITITLVRGWHSVRRHYLIATNAQVAENFFLAVCGWNEETHGEVLVYRGEWQKDAALYASIRSARLEDVVLADGLKETIVADFDRFFASEEVYNRYRIPWKRGLLLIGPPGNGKTCLIKAILARLDKPCLYVRYLEGQLEDPCHHIANVFARARTSAPCVLVLEDLDSLIPAHVRSVFLNEMDGLASNRGILVVATTNKPERLDPAILERPGRFDRKYFLVPPDRECRARYLRAFSAALEPELQLSEQQCETVADATEGFSYAYLKELLLSAMMQFLAKPETQRMVDIALENVEPLRSQMPLEAIAPSPDIEYPEE